ncbi:MAG: copper transport protein [Actinomycetota bacterium]|nr:copper transport protein [Actinomycetota bacterium]
MALVAALGLALLMGPGAAAHALVASSDPADGATLASSPSQVVITFTEQPDLNRSVIQVLDTSGHKLAGGTPEPVAGQPSTVARIPVPVTLPKGVYTVSWKSISAVDGHLATGAFAFGVGQAPQPGAARTTVKTPGPSDVAVVARWFYLYGLIGLLGLAFTELVVPRGAAAAVRLHRAIAVSWVAAAGGLLGLTEAQASGAGLGVGNLFSSSIGSALLLRGIPLLVAGLALLGLRRLGRAGVGLLGVSALGAMLGDVLKSHAAASASWAWLHITEQWVHIVAAGIWIGGLAGLLLILGALGPGNRGPAARRFSFWAGVAIVLVGITGTLRAFDEVGSWHQLFHTGFGQLIVVKIALFGALALLGAVNRFRNVAAVEKSSRGLRRTGGAELVAMAVVLAATALLQNLAPARTAAAAGATALSPVAIDAHDFATTYRLHLTVTPDAPGFNTFALRVTDYETGKPVKIDGIKITFHYTDSPTVGDSSLQLDPQPDGTYKAQGANMAVVGHWLLTVNVSNGVKSVDVPVDLVTQTQPEPTTSQAFQGSPTVFTVSLAGGNTVQIYIEPIRLGKAEFHATFFDAKGQELKMATYAAMSFRIPGGSATLLPFRQLSQGHFVADAPPTKGTSSFSVAGTTADGNALGATISLSVA